MPPRNVQQFRPEVERLGVFADAGRPFVAPQRPEPEARGVGSNALQIAEALRGFSGAVDNLLAESGRTNRRLTAEEEARNREAQERAGRAEALKLADIGLEALNRGVITERQHPLFVKGFKEQVGRNLGHSFARKANEAFQGVDLASTNINDFLNDQRRDFLSDARDPDISFGFQQISGPAENSLRAQFFQQQNALVRAQKREQVFQEIINLGSNQFSIEAMAGQLPDPQRFAPILNKVMAEARITGMRPEDIDTAVTDAIITLARRMKDPRVLDLALQKRLNPLNGKMIPGPGVDPENARKIQSALDTITNQNIRDEQTAIFNRRDRQDQARRQGRAFISDRLSQDPEAEITEAEISKLQADGYTDIRIELPGLRNLFRKSDNFVSDPSDVRDVEYEIQKGKMSLDDLFESANGGILLNGRHVRISPADYTRLSSLHLSLQGKGNGILTQKLVNDRLTHLIPTLLPGKPLFGVFDPNAEKKLIVTRDARQRYHELIIEKTQGNELHFLTNQSALNTVVNEVVAQVSVEFDKKKMFSEDELNQKASLESILTALSKNSGIRTIKDLNQAVNDLTRNTGPLVNLLGNVTPEGRAQILTEFRRQLLETEEQNRAQQKARSDKQAQTNKINAGEVAPIVTEGAGNEDFRRSFFTPPNPELVKPSGTRVTDIQVEPPTVTRVPTQ